MSDNFRVLEGSVLKCLMLEQLKGTGKCVKLISFYSAIYIHRVHPVVQTNLF